MKRAPQTVTIVGDGRTPDLECEHFRPAPSGQAFCIWQEADATARAVRGCDRDLIGLTRAQASRLAEWLLKRLAEDQPAGAKR